MKKRLSLFTAVAVAAGCFAAGPLMAADTASFDQRIQDLEAQLKKQEALRQELVQQLDGLRQQYLKDREDMAKAEVDKKAKATTTPVVTANDKDGFGIKSGDGSVKIKFSGLVQTDARVFTESDTPGTHRDTFLLRSARPTLSGSLGSLVDFTISPEFGGTGSSVSTTMPDAYADVKFLPGLKLRAGKTKAAFGLERLQSTTAMTFSETALSGNLMPNREIGFSLFGDLFRETLSYSVGVANGAVDASAASNGAETDDAKDVIARIFAQPFKNDKDSALKGLGFGIAATYGDRDGQATKTTTTTGGVTTSTTAVNSTDLVPSYKTIGQSTFFSLLGGTSTPVYLAGEQVRYSPQLYYYYKNLGFLSEYVSSKSEMKKGVAGATKEFENTGWQAAISYVLTGEDASYKGVSPSKPFDLKTGDFGAVEVGFRYSSLSLDDDMFNTKNPFNDSKYWSDEADAFSLALNWYLTKNLRYAMTYENTTFDGAPVGKKNVDDENVVIGRVEVKF